MEDKLKFTLEQVARRDKLIAALNDVIVAYRVGRFPDNLIEEVSKLKFEIAHEKK
jgi:hypothetical protein